MHIQKLLGTICVAGVIGAGSLKAQSSDTDIQAKAREALRQKESELNSSTTAPAAMPATAPTPPPAPAMAPAPAPMPAQHSGMSPEEEARLRAALEQATEGAAKSGGAMPISPAMPTPPPAPVAPPAAMVAPAPMPMHRRGLSPEEEARLRAALEQATTSANQSSGAMPTPPAMTPAPMAVVPPPAPASVAPVVMPDQAVATPDNKSADRDARMKLRAEIEAQHLAAEQAAAQQDQEARATRQAAEEKREAELAARKQGMAPVPAVTSMTPAAPVAMPLAGSKEQRLAELLRLYKADQITPTEYHEQRAKIVAEH